MEANLFVAASVLVIAMVIVLIVIFNGIVTRKNAVERAWAGVITQERQKNKILPELEKLISEHKEFEQGLLSKITQLRSGVSALSADNINAEQLAELEQSMKAVVSGINMTMEAYPELKTASLFERMMREVAEQQENIAAAIRIFNQNVEAFNAGIEVFPANLVNKALNKEARILVFSDAEAASGFNYSPNLN